MFSRYVYFCAQLVSLSTAGGGGGGEPPTTASTQQALGEMLEFTGNPDNLWAVTRDMLVAVVSHVRAPRYGLQILHTRRLGQIIDSHFMTKIFQVADLLPGLYDLAHVAGR